MNPQDAYSGLFSSSSLPAGYTPGTLSSYYSSLLAPIDASTSAAVGQAKTDAAARGLEGTPTETGGVAAANYYGGLQKNQALGSLAMNMAGLGNQDQEIAQQQTWQSGENALNRAAGVNLAQMGYANQQAMAHQQNVWNQQSGVASGIAGLAGAALGGLF